MVAHHVFMLSLKPLPSPTRGHSHTTQTFSLPARGPLLLIGHGLHDTTVLAFHATTVVAMSARTTPH